MNRALPRLWTLTLWLLLSLLATACSTSQPVERPPARPVVVAVQPTVPVNDNRLYGAEEALRDVLSGELQYVGTGRWPGVERSRACAFRNQRVVIVNAYCTLNETSAFRIEVYSPARGRVRIYAEANGAVSARDRASYFSFMVESGQPPAPATRIPPLTLAMSYEALQQYEQQRYDAFLPSCYGGLQNSRNVGGCLGTLAPRRGEWAAQNQAFLARANADWYSVIHQMRTLATQYGVEPKD